MLTHSPTNFHEPGELFCATCNEDVAYSNGACLNCFTPLELTRSVAERDNPCRHISILGQSSAGKTVYLGMMLDMLSRGHGRLRGVPNNAFSVNVQQQTISALENQRFPDKTPAEADQWNWVHCDVHNVKSPKRCVDVITPDLAGEAIAIEIENPGTFPTVREAVQKSSGVILLFDSEKVRDHGRSEDLFGIMSTTYLASLQMQKLRRRVRKLSVPLAILFTKADSCSQAMENPRRFATEHMPGTVQICKKKFSQHDFFAASVVGSSATVVQSNGAPMEIPLHIQPHGIMEPVEWVMKSMSKKR